MNTKKQVLDVLDHVTQLQSRVKYAEKQWVYYQARDSEARDRVAEVEVELAKVVRKLGLQVRAEKAEARVVELENELRNKVAPL